MSAAERGWGSKRLTMADKGGVGVRQMLTLADKGEKGFWLLIISLTKCLKITKYIVFLKLKF